MSDRDEVIDSLNKHFDYLFHDYGFDLFADTFTTNYWVVVLLSDDCRIRFLRDRDGVSFAVGPLWDPPGWQAGPWYDLRIVLRFLANIKDAFENKLGPIEKQFELINHNFSAYSESILNLFKKKIVFRNTRNVRSDCRASRERILGKNFWRW